MSAEFYSKYWTGKLEEMDRMISKIHTDVYEGRDLQNPSIVARLGTHEKDIRDIRAEQAERDKKKDRIELAVWAAVLMGIINLIFSHVH